MLATRPPFNYSYEFCILLFLIHMYEENASLGNLKITQTFFSAIISTTPQSRPTSTPPYFSISPSTRLLVLATFARLLELHIIP